MGVGVAILDSGVNPRHPHVSRVIEGRCFVPGQAPENYLDILGHGTAVAGAICEKSAEIELFIAKVFHKELVTSIKVLLDGLDWALDQPVSFINLSLSTPNEAHRTAFEARVQRALQAGIRIVSADGNLPGRLDGVINVVLDDTIGRGTYGPNYGACGWPRPIPGQPQERNLHGISFAVANVTGCLARDHASALKRAGRESQQSAQEQSR